MQVIGLCRFSYPAIGGFQVGHDSIAERSAYLYAPARMESRFRSFETLTLPALRAQTDGDFTLLIVIGTDLPDIWLERLQDLVADLPQAVIRAYPSARHRRIMQQAINDIRRFDDAPCLQFRMDDDDAVAVNFVERLRAVALDASAIARHHPQIGIDFNQGYILRPGPEGIAACPLIKPCVTAALSVMFQPDIRETVMNFSHAKLMRRMPVLSLTGEDMMIRGHDDFNDSRQKPGTPPVTLTPLTPEQEDHFRATFNIDAEHVRRVYSAP